MKSFSASDLFSVIFVVAVSDLLYGCIVSPFFVENYVRFNWARSIDYCR